MEDDEIKLEDVKKEEDILNKETHKSQNIEKQAKIVVITILVFLVLAIALFFIKRGNPTATIDYYKYGNFDIQKIKDPGSIKGYTYKMRINVNNKDYYVYPRYDPKSTEDIPIEKDTKQRVVRKGKNTVYLHIDNTQNLSVDTGLAGLELKKFLDNSVLYNIPVRFEGNSYTCADADEKTTVIFLKLGKETVIYQDKDNQECVIIQGKNEEDLIRASDRLIFYILGIMPREIK